MALFKKLKKDSKPKATQPTPPPVPKKVTTAGDLSWGAVLPDTVQFKEHRPDYRGGWRTISSSLALPGQVEPTWLVASEDMPNRYTFAVWRAYAIDHRRGLSWNPPGNVSGPYKEKEVCVLVSLGEEQIQVTQIQNQYFGSDWQQFEFVNTVDSAINPKGTKFVVYVKNQDAPEVLKVYGEATAGLEKQKQAREIKQTKQQTEAQRQKSEHKTAHGNAPNCGKCGAQGGLSGNVWMCNNLICKAFLCRLCYVKEHGFVPNNLKCPHCLQTRIVGMAQETVFSSAYCQGNCSN